MFLIRKKVRVRMSCVMNEFTCLCSLNSKTYNKYVTIYNVGLLVPVTHHRTTMRARFIY